MYFPKKDGIFGSSYFYKDMPAHRYGHKRFGQTYRLDRTHWKIMRTKDQICDEGNSEPNTTMCITRHLENKVGCSIGMLGADPHIERYHLKRSTIYVLHNDAIMHFRCNHTNQVNQYVMMARKIQHAINDMEIFKLTGCLSKCDKFHYDAYPRVELKDKGSTKKNKTYGDYYISFVIPNGRNEIREQVKWSLLH